MNIISKATQRCSMRRLDDTAAMGEPLWEEGPRARMMISGPGIPAGGVSDKPVELIDIYPTLLELAGPEPDPKLEGDSLVPLLKDPQADWPHVARTRFGPGNVRIRSERFRHIRYKDGKEEFYDHSNDQNEWRNQIDNPEFTGQVERHCDLYSVSFRALLGVHSTGHKAFRSAIQA